MSSKHDPVDMTGRKVVVIDHDSLRPGDWIVISQRLWSVTAVKSDGFYASPQNHLRRKNIKPEWFDAGKVMKIV